MHPQKKQPKKISVNAAWLLSGQVGYKVCQLVMLVTIARFIGVEAVGEYSICLAILAPLFMFLNLQLRLVLATDNSHSTNLSHYIGIRIWTNIGCLLFTSAILLLTNDHTSNSWLLMGVAVAKCVESFSDLAIGVWQKNEVLQYAARSLIIRGLISLTSFALGYLASGSMVTGIWASSAGTLLVLIRHDFPYAYQIVNRLDSPKSSRSVEPNDFKTSALRLVGIALPLAFATGLLSLEQNIPKYAANWACGKESLGLYSAASYITMIAQTLAASVTQAAIPRFSKFYDLADTVSLRRVLYRLIVLFFAVGGAATFAVHLTGRQILQNLYGKEFATQSHVLTILAAGASIQVLNMLVGGGLRAMRKFRLILIIQIISTSLMATTAFVFAREYGLTGIALTTVVTSAVSFVILFLSLEILVTKTSSRTSVV